MDRLSFSIRTSTATTMTRTTTTAAAFSASIAFSKGMVCVPIIRRVLSRGMSLRGVKTSVISFVKCENPITGVSLSGQAFGGRCYRGDLRNLSSNPHHIRHYFIGLGSCSHALITGYWVGPDMDDGWGFVEAWISQTS